VSFELAVEVFNDPLHLTKFDRMEGDEERWHILGMVRNQLFLLLAHTYRTKDGEESIRIISARKATTHERSHYEQE